MMLSEFIRTLLPIPYKHRGRGYDGADCWGLDILFYRDFLNIKLPDVTEEYDEDWAFKSGKDYFIENYHKQFIKVSRPQLYDVVLFQNSRGKANHAGIILNNGKFIHMTRGGVSINRYIEEIFSKRLNGFYRLKNENTV